MAQSAIVESVGTEGDLTAGPEGKEEVESPEGDPENPSQAVPEEKPGLFWVWQS